VVAPSVYYLGVFIPAGRVADQKCATFFVFA
jgi:hypothetical protein